MKNLGIKIRHLQEVIKIYLMATGGAVEHLGIISCSLIDVLSSIYERSRKSNHPDFSEESNLVNKISVEIIKIICLSVIERLNAVLVADGLCSSTHTSLDESEAELLPHLVLLRSSLDDLSSVMSAVDYTLLSQKVQELIDGIES
jgi:hypothetical protein